jgi:hypothetical protein
VSEHSTFSCVAVEVYLAHESRNHPPNFPMQKGLISAQRPAILDSSVLFMRGRINRTRIINVRQSFNRILPLLRADELQLLDADLVAMPRYLVKLRLVNAA